MAGPRFSYSIRRAQGSRIQVCVNDIPIVRGYARGYECTQTTLNEFLVPGENEITFEIGTCPWEREALWFVVAVDDQWDQPLLSFVWGAEGQTTAAESVLPRAFSRSFIADGFTFEPAFRRSSPAKFGCEGTPEQRELVRRVQEAVEWGQTDALMELLALGHEEIYVSHNRTAGNKPDTQRPEFATFFAMKRRTRPLDMADLHFDSRAGGRVAFVTRADGDPAIESITAEPDPGGGVLQIAMDLRMTMVDGQWRLC